MRTYEEITNALNENIPRDAIALRDGGGTKKLSYLEGWYVIDRMNKVFGQGNWAYDIKALTNVHSGEGTDNYGKPVFNTHYIAQVKVTAKFGDTTVAIEDVGYGDGSDKKSIGKAHELATKEAVTDALKRACKSFGMSMGLALYDKTQENVSDDDREAAAVKPGPRKADTSGVKAITAGPVQAVSPKLAVPTDRKALLSTISSMAQVAIAKKKIDKAGLVKYCETTFKKSKKEDLDDTQAAALGTYLKGLVEQGATHEQRA